MSGEPKTLTPQAKTLEEALMHLADHPAQVKSGELGWFEPWALRYESEQRAWAALTEYGDYVLLKEWPALITEITGVPVVARDEAAELRAANRAFVEFMGQHHRTLAHHLPSHVLGPLAQLWNRAAAAAAEQAALDAEAGQ